MYDISQLSSRRSYYENIIRVNPPPPAPLEPKPPPCRSHWIREESDGAKVAPSPNISLPLAGLASEKKEEKEKKGEEICAE